ncbi:MAG: type 2 isopentenyl-diphosphate Delta-isomerase [Tissierellia bacterium]|nr:type 2 isopentenyl-diphosphate Delta-isomerase [Tissierellia bacterium]
MKNRKNRHLELALRFYEEESISDFDNLKFVHHVFPEIAVEDVDISTSMAGFIMEQPFYINAMTGGSNKTKEINRKLGLIAKETDLLMASGSLSAALKDPDTISSFKIIRDTNPKGIIFANLGAEKTLEEAKRAIDILEADGLQIHVNAAQELIMPEGDRDFSNWLKNIEDIVNNIGVPIIVKEVGFGMSKKAVEELINIGVKTIDISGTGGTNFARIENYRRAKDKYDFLEGFGNSTVASLLEAQDFIDSYEILASGGICNSMDMVKALALGSKAVGLAALVLNMVETLDVEKSIEEINNWKEEIKILMTLLGKKSIEELKSTDIIISGNVKDWCIARNIAFEKFANRSE